MTYRLPWHEKLLIRAVTLTAWAGRQRRALRQRLFEAYFLYFIGVRRVHTIFYHRRHRRILRRFRRETDTLIERFQVSCKAILDDGGRDPEEGET